MEVPRHDTLDIAIDDGGRVIEGDGGYGGACVVADAGEFF